MIRIGFSDHIRNVQVTYPDPLLEMRYTVLSPPNPTVCLCAGYEGSEWRCRRFAKHLFNWIPYAGLSQEHQLQFGASNFTELLELAAAHIYATRKTHNRGEIGELMLHLTCILNFKTIPVLCKLVLKTAPNDTVKGFDGVHILPIGSSFEVWLGESKFYTDPKDAIDEAVKSIKEHVLMPFINAEKAMIFGHITKNIPHYEDVLKIFKTKTSGDELLKRTVFPVLVAYESGAVRSHKEVAEPYIEALRKEIEQLRTWFGAKAAGIPLRFNLVFVPLGNKHSLIDAFDALIKG